MRFLGFIIAFSTLLQGYNGQSSNIFSLVHQRNVNFSTSEVEVDVKNDFIVKLNFLLNEKKIVPYLRDLLYENYDFYNVTTDDFIEFSNIRQTDFDQWMNYLQKLNRSDIHSVENFRKLLDITNITFTDFFEKLKNTTNLNGIPMTEALKILNIDPGKFSTVLTFGVQNEIYDVLSEGVYSIEKFENAAKIVGTDLPTFFKNVKTIILDQMKMQPISYYATKFRENFNFDRKLYDDVWKVVNPNVSDVYRVVNFRRIFDNIYNRLHENVSLGVVTSEHEITIHKEIYHKMASVKDIVNIYAESVLFPEKIYDNLTIIPKPPTNFTILWSNDSLSTKIEIERNHDGNYENCSYIFLSFLNFTKLEEFHVNILNISENKIIIDAEDQMVLFNVGNPLICNGKLVGLASPYYKNLFAFDTFYHKSEKNPNAGFRCEISVFLLFHAIFLWLML